MRRDRLPSFGWYLAADATSVTLTHMQADSGQRITNGEPRGEADGRPIPPRYWWLKRLTLLGLMFVLVLGGVRWWWGWEAGRRLEAKIAEYKAAGQPVEVADFAIEPVANEDNAAWLLQQAAAKLTKPGALPVDVDDFYQDWQLVCQEREGLATLIDANAEALRLLREARDKPVADWGMSPTFSAFTSSLPSFSGQRQLAKLACLAARYQHSCGDDAAALDSLRDALAIGRQLDNGSCFIISRLVSVAVEALTAEAIEDIAPSLRVKVPPRDAVGTPPWASRAETLAFIEELLDDRQTRAAWEREFYGERAMQIDLLRTMKVGSGRPLTFSATPGVPWWANSDVLAWLLAPAIESDGIRMLEHLTTCASGGVVSWPTVRRLVSIPAEPVTPMWSVSRPITTAVGDMHERISAFHARGVAGRRMAAIALAVRLYELDHGARPTALTKLVPDYLAVVPIDPFRADGGPIGFVTDGPQPLLYDVNVDGVDDGGRFAMLGGGSIDRNALDEPLFLNGDRPRRRYSRPQASGTAASSAPASGQAVEHDEQVKDAGAEGEGGQQ